MSDDINKTLDEQSVTRKYLREYLSEYGEKVLFPRVEEIVDEKLRVTKDEILTSNDKLSKKLDQILKEQAAHSASYKRLEKRINHLEAVVKVLAEKVGIPINLDNFQN